MALPIGASARELPFGAEFPELDSLAVGEWWTRSKAFEQSTGVELDVPREQVIAFALYTQDQGELRLSAQFFPLRPDEVRVARLELEVAEEDSEGVVQVAWKPVAQSEIHYPGWSAHFSVGSWDSTRTVRYRVRHGESAAFIGRVRKDPIDQQVVTMACLSCNSSRTTGPRVSLVQQLLAADPDLLFFAGDQTYRHTEHTAGWIEFGLQFRELLRDRPTVTIPDDHDVGQSNLWGEYGKKAATPQGPSGGYFYPVEYVNMVQRQQTWHLPRSPGTVLPSGIGVYYTRLRCGGVDFAIIEDRKFKSGPKGKIPMMGPRPDHIVDPNYDRKGIDLPGLKLLGEEQLRFLEDWCEDWQRSEIKVVLSQTAFCGAVHLHGSPKGRLLADLDCNGWPQSGRNRALRWLRRANALHICGDQHLAVVVQHGIDAYRDGPFGFTVPAIVNTIYGRWWRPLDEERGGGSPIPGELPWTGDYSDGLGNLLTMWAYANPKDRNDERQRADGYGWVKIDRKARTHTLECWPRFNDSQQQFDGWPITIRVEDNDGRKVTHRLPPLATQHEHPVVQVIEEVSGEILYTRRLANGSRPGVFSAGTYRVKTGRDRPDETDQDGVAAEPR